MKDDKEKFYRCFDLVYGYFFKQVTQRDMVDKLVGKTVSEYMMSKTVVLNETAFLFQIASNKLKEYFKEKSSQLPLKDMGNYESMETSEIDTYPEFKQLLLTQLSELKKKDKEVIQLCVQADFTSNRVAQELGIKPSEVRKKLEKSLNKFRARLKKTNINI